MLENIVMCQRCKLNLNQAPLLDKLRENAIMVVGISAKKSSSTSEIPLDNSTKSGQLVAAMEKISEKYCIEIYRTNLVKCPPLGLDNKVRYPSQEEINACFPNILYEIKSIKPKCIILFGSLVQSAFRQNLKLHIKDVKSCTFPFIENNSCYYVSSYHPSYISRSSRRKQQYLQNYSALLDILFGRECD